MVDKIIAKLKPRSAPFNVRFFLYIAPEIYTKTKPIIKSASSPTNSVEENGNFKSVEDIKNVSGIGDNKFNEIKDSIVVK